MKEFIIMLLTILTLIASTSWAGGKEQFINRCGSCHKSGGKAPVINPADKAGVVWKKYFKRKRHPVDISNIPQSEMSLIISYLQNHAADSDQPEAAVIPK